MKNKSHNKSSISRRKFITTLGLAAGVSTIVPGVPSFISKAGKNSQFQKTGNYLLRNIPLKLGVLLPPSNIYPAMSENFVSGMNLYFDQVGYKVGGREIVLLETPIGFGPNSAVQKSQSLIETDKIDIVTGIVDMAVNTNLRNLFNDKRLFLIANQVGANFIRPGECSPFVIHNSLDSWKANQALGMWAAQNLGNKAFVASSFYESGYDALYAFNLGFENSGGDIIHTMVNNLPAEKRDVNPLLKAIEKSKPDVVFASYSGVEAIDFVHAYRRADFDRHIPLLGSGFMVDESLLSVLGPAALGIKSCFPWSSNLNKTTNGDFINAYWSKTGHSPDSFAVLGFETAQLVKSAVEDVDGDLSNTQIFGEALIKSKINSPRGQLVMNAHTQQLSSPLYLREVRPDGAGFRNEVINVLKENCSPNDYTFESDSDMKSGWLNPYLCA
jgi:branched-chain amino acid transport system substrate-binding protein